MPSSLERQAVSSNISQNFPYGSETEEERAAAVEKAFATFPGLREKVEAEATPLGEVKPDDHGAPVEKGGGYLTLTRPWPGEAA